MTKQEQDALLAERVALLTTINDYTKLCFEERRKLLAEVERLRTELAETQARELNHEGACERLKAEVFSLCNAYEGKPGTGDRGPTSRGGAVVGRGCGGDGETAQVVPERCPVCGGLGVGGEAMTEPTKAEVMDWLSARYALLDDYKRRAYLRYHNPWPMEINRLLDRIGKEASGLASAITVLALSEGTISRGIDIPPKVERRG